ncbi:MAG: hypothetical protein ACRCXE_02140, partial [Metamycoplasmataceae bacterium]
MLEKKLAKEVMDKNINIQKLIIMNYANLCDKNEESMDCSDLVNGTDPLTGNKTDEILSVKRKLYLKRLNLRRRKDKNGVNRNNLVFFPDAVYGLKGEECGKIIGSCSENFDQITINQMAAVLFYWGTGIVPLPWTFKRTKLANRYEMNYGAGGVIRLIDRNQNWKMFHGPVFITINSMLRYRVPNGGKNLPFMNLDAIAMDDLSLTIGRKYWKEHWCKAKDKTYYLGLDWMKNTICNSSVEILGDRIIGGPRWYEELGEFFQMGLNGVKTAANAVFNFVTKDMWTGLIDFLVTVGWYILYGGLIIIGLMLLCVMIKCFCTVMG